MRQVIYKETGEIDDKTPLEPFYEAILPLLENYGFNEKFPADKPSVLSGGLSGYQYDILIGELPTAFRYTNYTPGGYSAFPDEERTLESTGFVHVKTKEKFYIRISISGYPDNRLQIVIEFSGAETEVATFRNFVSPVLTHYNFESKNTEQTNETGQSPTPKTAAQMSLKPSPLYSNVGFTSPELTKSENKSASISQFETVLLTVIHGFWSENGFGDPVVANYFCRIPENWTKNGKIIEEFAAKIFLEVYGASWDGNYNENMARNVAAYNSIILDRRLAEQMNWSEMETDDRNRCQFYIVSEYGEIKAVDGRDFQK